MAYVFYLDKIKLPVTPESLNVSIKNQNTTVNLINDGEVNILKTPGLSEVLSLIHIQMCIRDRRYTTYVLGDGAFDYADIGAKVPNEMARDPFTDGGVDTLITRRRKCFAPKWISYEKVSQASLSPTAAELEKGENWTIAHSGESVAANRSFVDHKAIPIVRIISRGQ